MTLAFTPVPGTNPRWAQVARVGLRFGALVIAAVLLVLGEDQTAALQLGALVALAIVASSQVADIFGWGQGETGATLLVETAFTVTVLVLTGGWSSPFGAYLGAPLFFLALWGGALPSAGAGSVAVATLTILEGVDAAPLQPGGVTQTLVVIGASLAIGLLGRAMLTEAGQEHELTLGRVEQLGHVNAMLSTLHDLIRTMPAPLSVDEIIQVIRAQLDELFDADAVILLIPEGGNQHYRPVYAEGVLLPTKFGADALPPAVRERGPTQRPVIVDDLPPGSGLWDQARSGSYLWLWSRGHPSGLLALEHREPGSVLEENRDVLERLGLPLSLAIDNAVWFQRLRTIGAEEERQRIGARLHDRFAQSLAYVSMELDRTVRRHPEDEELDRLRDDVRGTLADLRETLRELRLRVTEEHGLVEVLEDHAGPFGERFGVMVDVNSSGDGVRPPLPVEQQLLRIAQELMALSQRELGATVIRVEYRLTPGRVQLVVADDGHGTPESEMAAEARHVVGVLRDRADAIGAEMELEPVPGEGTTTTVTLRGLL